MMTAAILVLLLQAAPTQHAVQTPQTAAPESAALKATIRLNIAKIEGPSEPSAGPLGNLGPLIAQLLTPEGPVEIDYVVAGESTRGEIRGRLAAFPRGTIVLQHVGDDSIRVLNPANKTWYELPASGNLGAMIGTPDVQLEPTTETATIAGHRAQRFRFTQVMRMPTPDGATLPSDFPRHFDLSGDVWSTDAFTGSSYAPILRTLQAASIVPGMEALTAGGRFPLRIAVRSSMMPGYEIRSEVVSVGTATPAARLFEIPDEYQHVQAPFGGIPKH